jgi:hypothetical protein
MTEPHPAHLTDRPSWTCRTCSQPWPCPDARSDLLAEFKAFPSVLTIYLAAQMHDALADLTSRGQPTPADLHQRFLGWARRPPTDRPRLPVRVRGGPFGAGDIAALIPILSRGSTPKRSPTARNSAAVLSASRLPRKQSRYDRTPYYRIPEGA